MRLTIQRGYVPGCIGRITELHARFYAERVGFGCEFEAKVARELAQFCANYAADRDGLWLLLRDGQIEGSLAIDGAHLHLGAHLRWFITSPTVQGRGEGTKLLGAALEFCRLQRYPAVYLWTFEGLHAARHLYEKFGFRLIHQQRGTQWGTEVTEQRFELVAEPPRA